MMFRAMIVVVVLSLCGPAGAQEIPTIRDVAEAFDREDYAAALEMMERVVAGSPRSAIAQYNLACARAMTGDAEGAEASLAEAIKVGFTDFHRMAIDDHLESIRGSRTFRAVLDQWRSLLDRRGDATLEGLTETFSPPLYTVRRLEDMRCFVISSFDDETTERAIGEMRLVDAFVDVVVPSMASPDAATDARPDPWVTVILPTEDDLALLLGRRSGVGGIYDHLQLRLVSRDVWASLRHEFFHALHWRSMDRLGQEHPLWIQEGIACLFEDIEVDEEVVGGFAVLPSWRTNLAQRAAEARTLLPLDRYLAMPQRAFMAQRPLLNYAYGRSIFLYLHSEGALESWYRAYIDGHLEDPSGGRAMSLVLGKSLKEVSEGLRQYLAALPTVSELREQTGGSLGYAMDQGEGDGPVVDEIVSAKPRRGAAKSPLRKRDVILSIDGTPTPTLDELYRVLGGYAPGDVVEVKLRRGKLFKTFEITLVAPENDSGLF